MAIEKYTTECIVVESFNNGEHDKVYKVFTRDFGMILAHAKSIRKLESKLRAHIQERSVSLITLVQGRDVFRLVGAEERYTEKMFIHEVVSLLKRFVRGEGAHKALYDRLIIFLKTKASYDISLSRTLLYYIVLVELGYADSKVIGAKSNKEYVSWTNDDLYTHCILSHALVKAHVHDVLKEMQL
ncbi:MAG: recombination protein O N-terminal domain-containing protein [Candidatus Pacebacteria bacterium]|nr:recombination protein O N-terminal domain-containing protein [Candidatus Paceibacterota bacterium]MBP9866782.1 recombination protein O N-terminal domain-containing protein [Candidatus Paceibacterota bacterium]